MNAAIARPTVLIVDDEFLIATEIESILEEIGYRSEIATTRERALAIIAAGGIDLAIIDIHLGSGGPSSDIADRLDLDSISYVICTGSTADEANEWFAGATIVAKPFLPQEIVDAVHGKLGSSIRA